MNRISRIDLDGKVAIVTGGSNGIGRFIAYSLAERGAYVVVVDTEEEQGIQTINQIESVNQNGMFIATDISNSAEVKNMAKTVLEKIGHIDILVNNAGVCWPNTIESISDEEWLTVLNINLTGTFYCCRAVLESMKKRGQGNIVNISSLAARIGSPLGGVHYSASKAGILGLTRHLAKEVAPFGIRVNAVCPGAIDTRIQRDLQTPEQIHEKISRIPLGRIGNPEDIGNVVAFIVSDEASFITGTSIDVNGGTFML